MKQLRGAVWIGGTFGVILIENDIGEQSARIEIITYPMDELLSSRYISQYGAKLTYKQASGFFDNLDELKYKKK